jgi:hypothetical protein
MSDMARSTVERATAGKGLSGLQTHGRASMNAEDALTELGLTGSGTTDSLTVDLDTGEQVTITRQQAADFPDAPLRSTVVVLDGVTLETRYAVDLIGLARRYFELVPASVA